MSTNFSSRTLTTSTNPSSASASEPRSSMSGALEPSSRISRFFRSIILLSSVLEEVLPTFQTPAGQGLARLPINSSHHQAIGIPGDGLHVSARCPQDGVVEAIEGGQANSLHAASSTTPSHFVLGVQWHPERTFVSDPASQAIFQRFVQEATVWSPRPILTSVAS
jgi:hypothetical protein